VTPEALGRFVRFLLDCGEGDADYLYLDRHSPPVVTTGVGCALFTLAAACALPWRNADGSPASQAAIQAAWTRVRSHPEMAAGGGAAYAALTSIRLPPAAVLQLAAARVAAFEAQLLPAFPGYAAAPEEAQEGLCRLAWATGAAGFASRWPRFAAAWNAGRWAECAREDVIPALDSGEPRANGLESGLFLGLAARAA
jgi:hypothetical protein